MDLDSRETGMALENNEAVVWKGTRLEGHSGGI
jgi:hypothetical protein